MKVIYMHHAEREIYIPSEEEIEEIKAEFEEQKKM